MDRDAGFFIRNVQAYDRGHESHTGTFIGLGCRTHEIFYVKDIAGILIIGWDDGARR